MFFNKRTMNYFTESVFIESVETESTATVSTIGVSTVTAVESAASSFGLLVQEAKATIPATNANATNFFISWV
jgi:hypothetical protein